MISNSRGFRLPRWAGMLIALMCFCYAAKSLPVTDHFNRWWDARWLYVAGTCWQNGESPYHYETFQKRWREEIDQPPRDQFVYPPSTALFATPISLLPWKYAAYVYDLMNIAALVAIAWFLAALLKNVHHVEWSSGWPWVALGAPFLLSGVPGVVHIGQMTLIAMAGTLGTYYFWTKRRFVPAIVCVAIAAIKPQVSFLPIFYLMLIGGHRFVLAGGVLTMLTWAAGISFAPWSTFWKDFRSSQVDRLDVLPINQLSGFTGFSSLCEGTFLELSIFGWTLVAIGSAIAVALWQRVYLPTSIGNGQEALNLSSATRSRRRIGLGLLISIALTGLFMPLHLYDYLIFMPIVAVAVAGGIWSCLWWAPGLVLVGRPPNVESVLVRMFDADPDGLIRHLPTVGAVWLFVLVARMLIKATHEVYPAESVTTSSTQGELAH